jgi:hypothetical protein
MTDFELAMLFKEYLSLLQSQYINLVSVIFAFLVAGYLVASKLQSMMVVVVITLFSAFVLDAILALNFLAADTLRLQELMAARIEAGSTELLFHSGARGDTASADFFFAASRAVAVAGGYIGSIVFFFYQRRTERIA